VARWSGAFLRRWLALGHPDALSGRKESLRRQETARDQSGEAD
jgi:hypothetical protein